MVSDTSFDREYPNPGTYTITLTVTDDGGLTGSETVEVLVNPHTPMPTVTELLLVVGEVPLLTHDQTLKDHLITEGYEVVVLPDEEVTAADAEDKMAVIIAGSVSPGTIGTKLTDVAVPLINLEFRLHSHLGLTESGWSENYGRTASQEKQVEIVNSTHEIAAGLSGIVTVTDQSAYQGWGIPGNEAIVIAQTTALISSADSLPQPSVFAYEAGSQMIGMDAPARRVAMFLDYQSPGKMGENGWALLGAAIDWGTDTLPYQPPLLFCPPTNGQSLQISSGQNAIASWQARIPTKNPGKLTAPAFARDVAGSVSYFDRLGRSSQSQLVQQTPKGHTLVSFSKYDPLGRVIQQYLPFGKLNPGWFLSNPEADQQSFYAAEFPDYASQVLYAETDIEPSPLNRVLENGFAGDSWQIDKDPNTGLSTQTGHTVQTHFRPNDPNMGVDIVFRWSYDQQTDQFTIASVYSAGTLSVEEIRDENGHRVLEYKDRLGRVLVQREEIHAPAANNNFLAWASTCYLYDDKGDLRHVVQPEGMIELQNNGYDLYSNNLLDSYVFSYTYDSKGRMISKKVPGAERVDFVYNTLNQVVFTQDGNRRTEHHWLFTKYDQFGRSIISGIYKPDTAYSRAALQGLVDTQAGKVYETRLGLSVFDKEGEIIEGYSNQAFPQLAACQVHSVSYYDDHHFFIPGPTQPVYENEPLLPGNGADKRTIGQITGLRLKVLEDNKWLWTVSFFDQYGQEIQTQADHLLGKDIMTKQVNFAGEIVKTITRHNGPSPQIITQRMCYDHRGRLIRTSHEIDQEDEVVLARYKYDELGRQMEKNLHSTDGSSYLQSVDYQYNIRGWMTRINQLEVNGPTVQAGEDVADLFSMQLNYDQDPLVANGETFPPFSVSTLYTGNIAAIRWQDAFDTEMHMYAFQYDGADRLLEARYADYVPSTGPGGNTNPFYGWIGHVDRYKTSYSYDNNGNIKTLTRRGKTGTAAYGMLDELTYDYEHANRSNRLASVTDAASNTAVPGISQFVDGAAGGGSDYAYDGNGNMTVDKNKDALIVYNHLNKPRQITFGNGNTITYLYDAAGTRIRQSVNIGGQVVVSDYINGFHYKEQQLEFFTHPEGRVVPEEEANVNYYYQYHHTDHLGNVRLTFSDLNQDGDITPATEILQTDQYYPFGMRMGVDNRPQAAVDQRYLYNGKELLDDLGLDWYDYGFRWSDQVLGRFVSVDPLAEDFYYLTTYQYASNTPIMAIDLDGLERFTIHSSYRTVQLLERTEAGEFESIGQIVSELKRFNEQDFSQHDNPEEGRAFAAENFGYEGDVVTSEPTENGLITIDGYVYDKEQKKYRKETFWAYQPAQEEAGSSGFGLRITFGAQVGIGGSGLGPLDVLFKPWSLGVNAGSFTVFEGNTDGNMDYVFKDGEVKVQQGASAKILGTGYSASRGFTGYTSGGFKRNSQYVSHGPSFAGANFERKKQIYTDQYTRNNHTSLTLSLGIGIKLYHYDNR